MANIGGCGGGGCHSPQRALESRILLRELVRIVQHQDAVSKADLQEISGVDFRTKTWIIKCLERISSTSLRSFNRSRSSLKAPIHDDHRIAVVTAEIASVRLALPVRIYLHSPAVSTSSPGERTSGDVAAGASWRLPSGWRAIRYETTADLVTPKSSWRFGWKSTSLHYIVSFIICFYLGSLIRVLRQGTTTILETF